jgi:hypothetical protein
MAAGSTYTPIATNTLGSSTATITFGSISGSYTDLVLVVTGTIATGENGNTIQLNGDTGSNYSVTNVYGISGTAGSNRLTSQNNLQVGRTGDSESISIVHFMNYSNTTTYKTVLARGNDVPYFVIATAGLWRSTAAINSIAISNGSGNFLTGSTFTLYGIAAA